MRINLSGREDEDGFLSHWKQTQETMNQLEEQDDITGICGIKAAKVKFIERLALYFFIIVHTWPQFGSLQKLLILTVVAGPLPPAALPGQSGPGHLLVVRPHGGQLGVQLVVGLHEL